MNETTKTTDELLKIISKSKNPQNTLHEVEDNLLSYSIDEYLAILLDEKKLKCSQVVIKSNLNPNYAYQIFSGHKKNPSRDKLLALSIGMSLSIDETQKLLRIAGLSPLYPRIQRDLFIIYALENSYTIIETNALLDETGFDIIA